MSGKERMLFNLFSAILPLVAVSHCNDGLIKSIAFLKKAGHLYHHQLMIFCSCGWYVNGEC